MANKQTRRLLKLGLCTKQMRGQQHPNNPHSGYAVTRERPLYEGQNCPTHFGAVGNKRRKPWRGAQPPK